MGKACGPGSLVLEPGFLCSCSLEGRAAVPSAGTSAAPLLPTRPSGPQARGPARPHPSAVLSSHPLPWGLPLVADQGRAWPAIGRGGACWKLLKPQPSHSGGLVSPTSSFLGSKAQMPRLVPQRQCLPAGLRAFSFLSLRENSISPEGAQDLARGLCTNNVLRNLEYVAGAVPQRLCYARASSTRARADGLDLNPQATLQGWSGPWQGKGSQHTGSQGSTPTQVHKSDHSRRST